MELLEIAKANAAKALGTANFDLPASLRAKESSQGTVSSSGPKMEVSSLRGWCCRRQLYYPLSVCTPSWDVLIAFGQSKTLIRQISVSPGNWETMNFFHFDTWFFHNSKNSILLVILFLPLVFRDWSVLSVVFMYTIMFPRLCSAYSIVYLLYFCLIEIMNVVSRQWWRKSVGNWSWVQVSVDIYRLKRSLCCR